MASKCSVAKIFSENKTTSQAVTSFTFGFEVTPPSTDNLLAFDLDAEPSQTKSKKKKKKKSAPALGTSVVTDESTSTDTPVIVEVLPPDTSSNMECLKENGPHSQIPNPEKRKKHKNRKSSASEITQEQSPTKLLPVKVLEGKVIDHSDKGTTAQSTSALSTPHDTGAALIANTKKDENSKGKKKKSKKPKGKESDRKEDEEEDLDALLKELMIVDSRTGDTALSCANTDTLKSEGPISLNKKDKPLIPHTHKMKSAASLLGSKDPFFISTNDPKLKFGNGKNLVAIGPPKIRDRGWLKDIAVGAMGHKSGAAVITLAEGDMNSTTGTSGVEASSAVKRSPVESAIGAASSPISHSSPFSFGFGL